MNIHIFMLMLKIAFFQIFFPMLCVCVIFKQPLRNTTHSHTDGEWKERILMFPLFFSTKMPIKIPYRKKDKNVICSLVDSITAVSFYRPERQKTFSKSNLYKMSKKQIYFPIWQREYDGKRTSRMMIMLLVLVAMWFFDRRKFLMIYFNFFRKRH
jgi:hypothetical protein